MQLRGFKGRKFLGDFGVFILQKTTISDTKIKKGYC